MSSSFSLNLKDVPEKPFQANVEFPKNEGGRSFQFGWFEKWKWLHYSVADDKAYCHTCITAMKLNRVTGVTQMSPAFISHGYNDWQHATEKKRGFRQHESSELHEAAVFQNNTVNKEYQRVDSVLSENYKDDSAIGRRILVLIIRKLQYLARQGLALRGTGSDEEANFLQLLLHDARYNNVLCDWLKKKSDKYISSKIQNEILGVMADMVKGNIADTLKQAPYISILADETSDLSNREQLVFCTRHVDGNFEAHEEFISLKHLKSQTAESIVTEIKANLQELDVPLTKVRGQCYDGCSTMKGANSGVSTQIKKENPKALYIHCYGHSANLAICDIVKNIKTLRNAHDIVHEITKLVKNSPKREAHFQTIRFDVEDEDSHTQNLQRLCPTRWTVRGKSFASVIDNYP